jgi:hypothetical protein
MTIVDFLSRVKEAFPETNPEEVWDKAEAEVVHEFCSIILMDGGVCSLQKAEGVCPYHRDSQVDFIRHCTFVSSMGTKCYNSLKTRDLKEIWCTWHLNMPKGNFRLVRIGDYIVIKGTPYAISDDMLSIIGRVQSTYMLEFELIRERDAMMEESARFYGLTIRFDD